MLSTNIALQRGGIWNYSVVFNSCPAFHVSTATFSQESRLNGSLLISLGNRDPTWELITSVWLWRKYIWSLYIKTSSGNGLSLSSCILCVIPCSSLLCSRLFLVAFSSGDFKFRESCLTVTKFLWKSYVNRNTDGLKENIHSKANIVACLSCMKQAIRSVENSYL